jgi:hypothetical protein
MQIALRRQSLLRLILTSGALLLLCGCVKFHITIDVAPDGAGTVGAGLGMTSQARAFIDNQDIGDPSEEIRKYLEQEATAGEVVEGRWTDGDYEWVEYRIPFESLEDLNSRVEETEFFESFQVTREPGLVNQTFTVDGVITPAFLESQVPGDVEIDVTQMFDVRLVVKLPGNITETNGKLGPRGSNTVWWRISSGPPIPIHATSEAREVANVRWFAVAGAVALVVAALVLIGLGAYRIRKRRSRTLGANGMPPE